MSSGAYAVTQCCATDFIPVSSEFSYELTPTYDPVSSYLSPRFHALYDENQTCTRVIPANYNSTIQITPAANEKYMRITGGTEYHGQVMIMPTVTQIGPVVETTLLPSIGTYPNVINTIDILTTVKPSSVLIEATPDEEDPDDPSAAFTGIIYNEGVLDVTQEDPNALNELTVHFRDDSKVLTLPEAEPMTGATALADGTGGTVPAPLMGEQAKFLRGDGTWAKVKSGDKYKAGEGVYILSGEVISDTFPLEIFAKSSRTSQYVIYGSADGVGDWDGTNYVLSVTVKADGEETLTTQVLYNARLYTGDYVDYSRQIIHHAKEDMRQHITLYDDPTYGTGWIVQTKDGDITGHQAISAGVTNYIEVTPGEIYWVKAFPNAWIGPFETYHCIFDENYHVTRYFSAKGAGAMTIEIQPGEKYARFVGKPPGDITSPGFLYRMSPYEEPCVLPTIVLYPNKINTINVANTNKPSEI
jgi:hypothetical protein